MGQLEAVDDASVVVMGCAVALTVFMLIWAIVEFVRDCPEALPGTIADEYPTLFGRDFPIRAKILDDDATVVERRPFQRRVSWVWLVARVIIMDIPGMSGLIMIFVTYALR